MSSEEHRGSAFPLPQSLRSEFRERVLGYYDFDRFQVFVGAHADRDIIKVSLEHESSHQSLNLRTTYGHLLNRVAKEIKDNTSASPAYSRLLDLLISKCAAVHEMHATYQSLILSQRTDILPILPQAYRECFRYMESAVKGVPARRLWRSVAAAQLAEMAMLANPHRMFEPLGTKTISRIEAVLNDTDLMSPDYRIRVLHDGMHGFDLTEFHKSIENHGVPAPYLEAFATCDEPEDILSHLNKSAQEWPRIVDTWVICVRNGFFDRFESLLPGLEDARRDIRLYLACMTAREGFILNSFSIVDRTRGDRNDDLTLKLARALRDDCNQRIIFWEHAQKVKALIVRSQNAVVLSTQLNMFRRLQRNFVLYLVPRLESIGSQIHLTDVGWKSGFVSHIVVQGQEQCYLVGVVGEATTIVEIINESGTWDVAFFARLARMAFVGRVFLYYSGNPIELIEQLLTAGGIIKWYAALIHYALGPVDVNARIQVCLYWTSLLPFPIFHLSNDRMTEAISQFDDAIVGNPERLRLATDLEVADQITNDELSMFIDHPAFNYYLSGTTAYQEISVARGDAQGYVDLSRPHRY